MRVARKGRIYSAFFADKKYGGQELALAAAEVHYLKLRQKLGLLRHRSRQQWSEIVCRRGKSGIHGVRQVIIRGKNGGLLKSWMATWSPEPGVVRKKQFSIRKFGEEKAKKLAIRARRRALRNMK